MASEELHRLVARHDAARHLLSALASSAILRFDRRQVLGREGPLVREVVVEAVLDHRADGHLRVREELLDRLRQQVRGGMADDLEAVRRPCR